ncbi:hypothetical protein O6H91_03G043500 [Diphasiastrum complanatum]|uniref:Uncharacterized protein n=2 Tax=Diphasiastrum complanatum TaxID=34168 RepID=A0ACC2E5B0_DIPCM|nr:hypothetical protein O6H91_03G032100 [Diphasiastrum complanatum]KAJ7561839.1 hypothetical protein O6H91_03G043500 [Diphasiastrum complanatum]
MEYPLGQHPHEEEHLPKVANNLQKNVENPQAADHEQDTGNEEVVRKDEKLLNKLGYKQEYKRVMSPFQQWAYTFDYTAPLGFVTGYYGYMYTYGGPVTIFWAFIATSIGTLCMAFAMSEIASAFPTLGSVYFWVAKLVPQKHAPITSWFVGWAYLIGSFSGTALNEYLLAQLIATSILIGTGGAQSEGYQMSNSGIVGITAALFLVHFLVSIVNTKWLGYLSDIGAAFQILSIAAICITLLAVAPKYQSAKFVFTNFVHAPGKGIKNPTLVVLLGLPWFQSILTGFEVGSHVVEEVVNAATASPRAMINSMYATAGTELALLLSMTFCIQNPENLLSPNTATGGGEITAASQIFYDVFQARFEHGAAGAIVFTLLAACSLFFGNITNVTLTARMAYAMARDQGLPGYKFLVKLTRGEKIPFVATIVTVVGSFACTLPAMGSNVAFNAITAMSTITAYGPYTAVLLCRHIFDNDFKPGPFSLGRWAIWLGGFGSAWGTLMSLLFCLPPDFPITGGNFNYAAPSLVGCMLAGAIYWYTSGKYTFHGPRRTIGEPSPADIENNRTSQQ